MFLPFIKKSRPLARFRIEGKKLGIFLGNKGKSELGYL